MTEAVWLVCTNPRLMFDHAFRSPNAGRKERLYACACCRRLWCLLTDARTQDALAVAEQLADKRIGEKDLWRTQHHATAAKCVLERKLKTLRHAARTEDRAVLVQGRKVRTVLAHFRVRSMLRQTQAAEAIDRLLVGWPTPPHRFPWTDEITRMAAAILGPQEQAIQANLLRDIVGNPFRTPSTVDPAWLAHDERCAGRIAQSIYDSGSFEDVPILADALEDAGCTDAEILNHCRSGTEHVRGCWVVDLLLANK